MSTRATIVSNLPGGGILASAQQFLKVLEQWSANPALQHLFLLRFETIAEGHAPRTFPAALESQIVGMLERTGLRAVVQDAPSSDYSWDLQKDNEYLNTADFISSPGCMLVQGVNIPGEQWQVETASVEHRGGLVPMLYGSEREPFMQLTTQLYESNTSFVDTVIRPWMILASHYGLVARDPSNRSEFLKKNIKCNIDITLLAKTVGRKVNETRIKGTGSHSPRPDETTIIQRKRFKFYNAVPISMDAADLTYNPGQGLQNMTVQWAYTHYTVQNLAQPGALGGGQRLTQMLMDYAGTGLTNHWQEIRREYDRIWAFQTGVRKGSRTGFLQDNRIRILANESRIVRQVMMRNQRRDQFLRDRGKAWNVQALRINVRNMTRLNMLFGELKEYGPKGTTSPEGNVPLPIRWKAVGVTNLCGGVNGRPDICKPPPPEPGSALDRIRSGLRNIGKLSRNARSIVSAFKRIGKAKGVKGKVGAFGDLNKQIKKVGSAGGRPGSRHKTLGGGMPKVKNGSSNIGKAQSIIDEAKKAARAVTGKKKAGGAF